MEDYPHLVQDDERAKVWFKHDHRFKQPQIALTFRIETPKVYRSAKNLELAKLYEAMMPEGLNELVYPIQVTGLSYSLSIQKKEAMIRGLKNKKLGQAYSRGGYYNYLMLLQDQYADKINMLKRKNFGYERILVYYS